MKSTIGTIILAAALFSFPAWSQEPQYTDDFRIESCEFEIDGRNAYFSLGLVQDEDIVLEEYDLHREHDDSALLARFDYR